MPTDDRKRDAALKANIQVHAQLANSGEYNKSPHFLPENQEKVRKILSRLLGSLENVPAKAEPTKAIDFGCGTGFIVHMIRNRFTEVHGVDITRDMMKQIDLSSGNVFLHEGLAEKTEFTDNTFDFASAYSFMDHLFNYRDFLREAFRVLKPGGIFYSDLNPNRDFILAMGAASSRKMLSISPLVAREIQGALQNGQYYMEKFGIDAQMLESAEPGKSYEKGFSAEEVLSTAKTIGFSKCDVEFEWYLGQAKIMHEHSLPESHSIESYLNMVLPASSHLFKYLRFIFVK